LYRSVYKQPVASKPENQLNVIAFQRLKAAAVDDLGLDTSGF
jgi:hypothetical protein